MKRVLTPLLAIVLVLAACGGDDDTDADASGAVVTMTEFTFDPPDVAVTVGEPQTVEVKNAGSINHDWVVVELGREVTDEDGIPDDLLADGFASVAVELAPGQALTVDLDMDTPGTYQVICAIPGHFSAGMVGELVVNP